MVEGAGLFEEWPLHRSVWEHILSLIAQLVERETVNLEVVGSIPTWRGIFCSLVPFEVGNL